MVKCGGNRQAADALLREELVGKPPSRLRFTPFAAAAFSGTPAMVDKVQEAYCCEPGASCEIEGGGSKGAAASGIKKSDVRAHVDAVLSMMRQGRRGGETRTDLSATDTAAAAEGDTSGPGGGGGDARANGDGTEPPAPAVSLLLRQLLPRDGGLEGPAGGGERRWFQQARRGGRVAARRVQGEAGCLGWIFRWPQARLSIYTYIAGA